MVFRNSSHNVRKAVTLSALCGSLLIAAGARAQDQEDDFFDDFFASEEEQSVNDDIHDPLEPFNRVMFDANDLLYRYMMKPVARGLRVVPEPARESVANFYSNLQTPVSGINALLQFDVPNAGSEFSRFFINSTVGILGLFDPATEMGIAADREDFGQTMARWGLGHGFYLVIPFFGPTSLRDGVGMFGDAAIDPVLYAWDPELGEYAAYRLIEAEVDLSLDQDTYESIYSSSLDPYAFFRSTYSQRRANLVDN